MTFTFSEMDATPPNQFHLEIRLSYTFIYYTLFFLKKIKSEHL